MLLIVLFASLGHPGSSQAHGGAESSYRTEIVEITPSGLPVKVRMSDGDQLRFENVGSGELVLCGYDATGCEEWARLGLDGVFEDRNSKTWFANAEAHRFGDVPESAGSGEPDLVRLRREPRFYAYHDHRVHWMGGYSIPPNVDPKDPSPQQVFESEVPFRYDGEPGTVRVRLLYIGGRSRFEGWGEYAIIGGSVVAMLGVFALDARRRRRGATGSTQQQLNSATEASDD